MLRSLKCCDDYISGWILIDRCGKHFGTILNYLRDDTIALPKHRQEIKELMAEAKYYLIQGLVDMCQAALQVRNGSSQSNIAKIRQQLSKMLSSPFIKPMVFLVLCAYLTCCSALDRDKIWFMISPSMFSDLCAVTAQPCRLLMPELWISLKM